MCANPGGCEGNRADGVLWMLWPPESAGSGQCHGNREWSFLWVPRYDGNITACNPDVDGIWLLRGLCQSEEHKDPGGPVKYWGQHFFWLWEPENCYDPGRDHNDLWKGVPWVQRIIESEDSWQCHNNRRPGVQSLLSSEIHTDTKRCERHSVCIIQRLFWIENCRASGRCDRDRRGSFLWMPESGVCSDSTECEIHWIKCVS